VRNDVFVRVLKISSSTSHKTEKNKAKIFHKNILLRCARKERTKLASKRETKDPMSNLFLSTKLYNFAHRKVLRNNDYSSLRCRRRRRLDPTFQQSQNGYFIELLNDDDKNE